MPAAVLDIPVPGGGGLANYTCGFQPDFLIAFSQTQTSHGTAASCQPCLGFGIVGTGISFDAEQLDGDTVPNWIHQLQQNAGGTAGSSAFNIHSFNSDGFTLNWAAVGVSGHIVILAVGGAGVSAKVGTLDLNAANTSQSVTGVGFQPELLMLLHTNTADYTSHATDVANAFLGATDGVSQWAMAISGGRANIPSDPADESRVFLDDSCFISIATFGPDQVQNKFEFGSFDSDGFTLDRSAASGTSGTTRVGYLCVADSDYDFMVGTETHRTTTGTKKTTTGETCDAVLLCGGNCVVNETAHANTAHSRFFIGAAAKADLSQGVTSMGSQDAVGDAEASKAHYYDRVLTVVDGNQSTEVEASMDSIDETGWTLDYTTVDGNARSFGWVTFRSRPEDPFVPQIYRRFF